MVCCWLQVAGCSVAAKKKKRSCCNRRASFSRLPPLIFWSAFPTEGPDYLVDGVACLLAVFAWSSVCGQWQQAGNAGLTKGKYILL